MRDYYAVTVIHADGSTRHFVSQANNEIELFNYALNTNSKHDTILSITVVKRPQEEMGQ